MKEKKEFFVPYIDGSLGSRTKKTLKRFVLLSIAMVVLGALFFGISQNPFANSTFELTSETKIVGIFHESPYPMLRVSVAKNNFKNILLLGFGKFGANPYLKKIRNEVSDLNGKKLAIEGNLIYYNGKTLIQITDQEKVTLVDDNTQPVPNPKILGKASFQGEIIDPKCYFGVMKPGAGKIHRSCAVLCISGGIPPVFAVANKNAFGPYFLLTDLSGNAINQAVLPFVGKPAKIKGIVEKKEDWYALKIDVSDIVPQDKSSEIYK